MMLSKRLHTVLGQVGSCDVLADIGTDHAYLPIEACNANICKTAVACDVNQGPLQSAQANIKEAGHTGRIETRLGNGLEPLNKNEADCIVISGMGGMRIWDILQQDPNKARYASKLILQPQHDLEALRRKLHSAGFEITDEKLVLEDARFYVILQAAYTGKITTWKNHEYFLGKFLTYEPFFAQYLQYNHEKISRYIQSINDCDAKQQAEQRMKWLEGEL